jgi:hypothetical protein
MWLQLKQKEGKNNKNREICRTYCKIQKGSSNKEIQNPQSFGSYKERLGHYGEPNLFSLIGQNNQGYKT